MKVIASLVSVATMILAPVYDIISVRAITGPTTIPVIDFIISLFTGSAWSWIVLGATVVGGVVAVVTTAARKQ